MSPSSREINGPRLSPLKIHKDSHRIQKQSSSSTTTTSTTTTGGHKQLHQPIIIYTNSPKVIHTQARDFMALVQKLTGLSRNPAEGTDACTDCKNPETKPTNNACSRAQHPPPPPPPPPPSVDSTAELGFDLPQQPPAAMTSSFLSEIPLFTPSSVDHFFCSPKSLYRFPEAKAFPDCTDSQRPRRSLNSNYLHGCMRNS